MGLFYAGRFFANPGYGITDCNIWLLICWAAPFFNTEYTMKAAAAYWSRPVYTDRAWILSVIIMLHNTPDKIFREMNPPARLIREVL